MVARVRPSLDPFQCGRPEISSGMAPIMAHLHACHNLRDAFATTPARSARAFRYRRVAGLRQAPTNGDDWSPMTSDSCRLNKSLVPPIKMV